MEKYSGFFCHVTQGGNFIMEKYLTLLKEKIEASDMVLVGIGESFGYTEKQALENKEYSIYFDKLKEENEWAMPYVYAKVAEQETDEKAYLNLAKLLENKNYFIVSLRTDDLVYKKEFGFKEERIVTPCGGVRKLQCENNCNNDIFEVPSGVTIALENFWANPENGLEVPEQKCSECNKNLMFNRMGASKYCEEGYLPMWEKYTKWLQGTLNHNLCILELGAGMKYPSVIRWQFEKMAFFNKKASIFRVHHKLYQLTEELSEKGYAVPQHPIEFLSNSFE